MISGYYRKWAESLLTGSGHASWVTFASDNLIMLAVSAGYTVDLDAHQFITDLGANIVKRSGNLTGKSVTGGTFNATVPNLASVTGSTITQIVLAKDTGTDATSPLILWINSATGLPDAPNGSDISIAVDSGQYHVFSI